MENQRIIAFDGVCNFCNAYVNFVIRRDPEARFLFTPIQSETGRSLLSRFQLDPRNLETFVLVKEEKCLVRSDALLEIMRELGGCWKVLYLFVLVPRPLRDCIYDLVARNRYRWFGRRDSCMVPTEDVRSRFLD